MTASGMPIMRAKDIMDTEIHFIDGVATAKEAVDVMKQHDTTTLIVQKRNVDDAWGIVVSQDVINGVIAGDKRSDELHVYEVMSKPIVTVPPDMDIRYVARLMIKIGVRRIPVEDCGELVGIVSQSNLILKSNLF